MYRNKIALYIFELSDVYFDCGERVWKNDNNFLCVSINKYNKMGDFRNQ